MGATAGPCTCAVTDRTGVVAERTDAAAGLGIGANQCSKKRNGSLMLAGIDWPYPFSDGEVPISGNHFQPGNAAIRILFDRVRHDEENFDHWRAHDRDSEVVDGEWVDATL